MNCETFRAAVEDVERPGALNDEISEALLSHAESCIECARELHRTRTLTRALRSMARADEWKSAPPAMEARLGRAFRTQVGWRKRRSQARWWMGAAAALILALAAGLAWRRTQTSAPGGAVGPIAVQSPAAKPAERAGSPSELPARRPLAAPQIKPPAGRRVSEPEIDATLQPEELNDFLPLPYADVESPLGSGEVVRIQLSASSLALLGIPVSDPNSSQSVVADVALGEDGIARAIRFVSGPVIETTDQ